MLRMLQYQFKNKWIESLRNRKKTQNYILFIWIIHVVCMLNTFDTLERVFKQIYSFIWCYMCYINLDYFLKFVIVQTSRISISCDPPFLPSKNLIFFVCVASATVKQIDSAITWILSILQKQKQHVSVMGSNTWLNMGLMPFHIYAYNGVWL